MGEALTQRGAAPTPAMWLGISVSALAGYGAMGFMLALIAAYGATMSEIVKTLRKVLQVRIIGGAAWSLHLASARVPA